MADNFTANPGAGGAVFASDDVAGVQFPRIKITYGEDGSATDVSNSDPMPVTVLNLPAIQPVSQSGAWSVSVSNTVPVSFTWAGLTDAQLRATPIAVTLTSTTVTGTVAVTGPLTDAQLRASAVPVSFTWSGLTDAQLRATPVPVSGTVAATQSGAWNIGSITTLPPLPAGTNNIGDVDVLSLPALPAGANTIGNVNINKAALTPASPTTATVNATSAQAVATNANRKGLYLKNTSTSGQRISLGLGVAAVLDSGITLETGDVFFMDAYSLSTGAVNAIASAASGRLSVQEWS